MIGTEERRESARTRTGSGRQTKVIGLGALILLALVAIGAVPRLMRDRLHRTLTESESQEQDVIVGVYRSGG